MQTVREMRTAVVYPKSSQCFWLFTSTEIILASGDAVNISKSWEVN